MLFQYPSSISNPLTDCSTRKRLSFSKTLPRKVALFRLFTCSPPLCRTVRKIRAARARVIIYVSAPAWLLHGRYFTKIAVFPSRRESRGYFVKGYKICQPIKIITRQTSELKLHSEWKKTKPARRKETPFPSRWHMRGKKWKMAHGQQTTATTTVGKATTQFGRVEAKCGGETKPNNNNRVWFDGDL